MKSNREILSELLSDKAIKKILIGESHLDNTSKDLLLDNMDLFIDKSVTNGRNVEILLEFVNVKIIRQYEEIISKLVASDTKEANTAIDLLIDKYIFPASSRCYETSDKIMNLIKTALYYRIDIHGAESTTSSNISVNKRIELFNVEASKLINQSSTDDVVILLAGSTHMVDIVDESDNVVSKGIKSRVSQENDTIAWLVKDSENQEEEIKYNEQIALSNTNTTLKLQFDIVTVKDKEVEQQRTLQLAGNQLKPSLVVSNASPSIFSNFIK